MYRLIIITVSNALLFLIFFPRYLLFWISTFNVYDEQKKILFHIVRKNKKTLFGKINNFSKIKSYSDYKNIVPISTYESYKKYIDRIRAGEKNILTSEKIILLEPTSGSMSASKLIPYTKQLKKEFLNGIAPWIFNILLKNIPLFTKTSYWSITPNIEIENTNADKIKIGFENDSDYFGFFSKRLIRSLWSVPEEISCINNEESFFYVTLLFLLKDKYLGFISIWSPTLIHVLFKNLMPWIDNLLVDLKTGKINDTFLSDSGLKLVLEKKLGKNTERSNEIQNILNNYDALAQKTIYEKIWPNVILISAWTGSDSQFYSQKIKNYFPNAKIHGKGLLATECFASFPMGIGDTYCLSVRSHFFEFINIAENKIYLANELKSGCKYSILVTTGGGLYRYKLFDIIEVYGFIHNAPLIKFIGKEENVSDICGEKLNEIHVENILHKAFDKFSIKPIFYLVAPETESRGENGYTLFIENDKNADFLSLLDFVEEKLRHNFHYNYCRKLGQLNKLKIFLIEKDGIESYMYRCSKNSQRIGNIKIKILDKQFYWSKYFKGNYI